MKETQHSPKLASIHFIYFLLILSILIFAIISITMGITDITVRDTFHILWKALTKQEISPHISLSHQTIILQLRLPRVLLALLTGVNLAVTGSVYQAIFRNAMADPYMLGISSGASLGAGIGFFVGGFLPIYAFVGAILANILVMALSGGKGKSSTMRLLLAGIAINYFFSSVLSLLRTYSSDRNLTLFSWGMGSLSAASYMRVGVLATVTLPILCILFIYRKELNLLLMGEDVAKSLGGDVVKLRRILLGLSSILIATTVAFTGTIGFVGLIIPHIVRMIWGSNYRITLPMGGLIGMLFLLLCDNLSRMLVANGEIPLGIITSIFGAPYFMYLIYKERKREF